MTRWMARAACSSKIPHDKSLAADCAKLQGCLTFSRAEIRVCLFILVPRLRGCFALGKEKAKTNFDVVPNKTALINIDMQNCFVENSPVAAPRGMEILPRINILADACRKEGALVIRTVHVVRPDGSDTA